MSDTILVADGDAARGRRVAEACRAIGIEARVVTHGAAALEIALVETPAAMIAQVELPLIDGMRLAEILHANPRTRSMAMLFVGDGSRDGAARDTQSGQVIPGHAEPDTIAHFIQAVLRKRSPEPLAATAGRDAPGVEGELTQVALSELIELFHVNRKTGVIELRQRGGRRAATGRIALRGGDVIQAQTGSVEGEKALYRLLAWRRGSFAFREGAVDERASIERPTRALLREAQRQADEWQRTGSELPAAHARIALKVARSSLPNVLHPLTQEVLLALDLSGRVQEVLDRCSFPDYQVLRTLQTLIRRGMVELHAENARPETAAGGLFAPSLVVRLRDWLEQGRSRDAVPVDAKLLLIASQPEAASELVSLLARLPGVEHTPRGETPGVWQTLRIAVDEDIAIELFEVPADARFAPIWPIAAHGALATLFVHAGGIDASVAALRRAIEEVGALPRSRGFHLLLEKANPRAVAALSERLALFDDRSVLAVSPERPDAAAASLRELLARLLP